MSTLPIALASDSRAARSSAVTGPASRSTSSGVTFWLSAMTLRSSFDILGNLAEWTTDAQCLPAQETKPFRRAVSGAGGDELLLVGGGSRFETDRD